MAPSALGGGGRRRGAPQPTHARAASHHVCPPLGRAGVISARPRLHAISPSPRHVSPRLAVISPSSRRVSLRFAASRRRLPTRSAAAPSTPANRAPPVTCLQRASHALAALQPSRAVSIVSLPRLIVHYQQRASHTAAQQPSRIGLPQPAPASPGQPRPQPAPASPRQPQPLPRTRLGDEAAH